MKSFSVIIEGHPFWISDLAAAFSFKIAYLGIAICNLKSTHKDHPPRAAKTFNYSRPQIILNNAWFVLFVVSFIIPFIVLSLSFPFLSLSFPFLSWSLSFHVPFNVVFLSFHFIFISFPFIVRSMSFRFLSLLFLSFDFRSFPFMSNSNQNFLGYFWISRYLGPALDQGGVLFRGGHYIMAYRPRQPNYSLSPLSPLTSPALKKPTTSPQVKNSNKTDAFWSLFWFSCFNNSHSLHSTSGHRSCRARCCPWERSRRRRPRCGGIRADRRSPCSSCTRGPAGPWSCWPP